MQRRAIFRIKSDLKELEESNLDYVHYYVNEEDMTQIYVMIFGSKGTPYEDCPFFFKFDMPREYPLVSPKVKFCTSDGRTRFNPNLYVDGKVCLSILGTWSGEPWTCAMTILTVINSICGLVMIDDPLKNEPGWEGAPRKDLDEYNKIVEYRSFWVAYVDQLENCPDIFLPFKDKMIENLRNTYDSVISRIRKLKNKIDGEMVAPRYGASCLLNYTELEKRMEDLGNKYGLKKRKIAKDCDIGDIFSENGKDYVIALNKRGVKFWKKK